MTRATCAGLGELRSRLQGPQAPAFLLAFLERSPDGVELQALWAAQATVRPASPCLWSAWLSSCVYLLSGVSGPGTSSGVAARLAGLLSACARSLARAYCASHCASRLGSGLLACLQCCSSGCDQTEQVRLLENVCAP